VVLSNVSTGVISLDPDDNIATINDRAAALFKVQSQDYIGRNLKEALGEKYYRLYRQMILSMGQYSLSKMTRQIEMELNNHSFPCLFTISRLGDLDKNQGTVIGFDDLTDVFKSQKIEAWKEVARRIAHEIKNPLTPIKLSAQRLQKKFGSSINDEAFKACTDMIIQQTDEMKRLVNEFSEYARMPALQKEIYDMNALVRNISTLYSDGYKKVAFDLTLDSSLEPFLFDQDQIKRVLINLIENALVAVENVESAKIKIATKGDSARQISTLTVSDNGHGVADGNYTKLFEPYFSTKKSGSGLGLAIVSKIVEDHGGIIQAYGNTPQGLSIKMDLPYKASVKDQNV
jgi:two-component system nitrogen regulation sensor histidine kinase NtrY